MQMEKHERFALLTCELPERGSCAIPVSDGTACSHEVGKRKIRLGFPSLVLTYTHLFRVDQVNRTAWFVLTAKEKQRCFLCDGGQDCSST